MTITIHDEMVQGSDEWHQARCGLLTASEVKLLVTPKELKAAKNDKVKQHLYELLAQRVTQYVEPMYIGDDMLRGKEDEIRARELYNERFAPVKEVGFITNNKWGFTLGFSPDGLVGDEGQIECKSRRQKYQIETIIENVMPEEYMLQVQTGLAISERGWCDFLSYSGGMHMVPIRVYADEVVQDAIINVAGAFEQNIAEKLAMYNERIASNNLLIPTERVTDQEMMIT